MKKYIIVIIYLLFFVCSARAQLDERLSKLEAPSSPASYVIGFQPSTMLNPNNYQDFEAAIFSNFSGPTNEFTIPNNFGIEFTPYWFGNYGLTINEYLNRTNLFEQGIRNMALSIASTQSFTLEDSTKTNAISFGARTRINITQDENTEGYKLVQEIVDYQSVKTDVIQYLYTLDSDTTTSVNTQMVEEEVKRLIREKYGDTYTDRYISLLLYRTTSQFESNAESLNNKDLNDDQEFKEYRQLIDDIVDNIFEISPKLDELKEKVFVPNYSGLYAVLAVGTLLNFPGNNFKQTFMPKTTLWATLNYNPGGESADFLNFRLLLRKEWLDTDYYNRFFPTQKIFENNTDLGVSIGVDHSRFTLNFESVWRWSETRKFLGTDSQGNRLYSEKRETDYQLIGSLGYRISENMIINYGIGKKLNSTINLGNTLHNQFTINFSFGALTKGSLKSE